MESQEKKEENKGYSIASMVLGIISVILFCFTYISIPCAILAIIFAVVGKNKGGKGMATAGLVLGIISVALCVLTIVGAFSFFTAFSNAIVDSSITY